MIFNYPIRSARFFFWVSLLAGAVITALSVLINIHLDIYGLHQLVKKKNKRIYYNEGYSKFLLAKNYIPNNFNGILIGPSLSDNFNTKKFNSLNLYNLSVMGARATDMRLLIEQVLAQDNDIKLIILSVDPYVTEKQSNVVDTDERTYYEHFGSYNLVKTYAIGLIRRFNLYPSKYPKNEFDEYGFNNYFDLYRVKNIRAHIEQMRNKHSQNEIQVDSTELNALGDMVHKIQEKGILFVYFFHPLPKQLYESSQCEYVEFKRVINGTLKNANYLDFNLPEFNHFTTDLSNYIDHGHVSNKGQRWILEYLENYYDKIRATDYP